jgi:hypothetical protein
MTTASAANARQMIQLSTIASVCASDPVLDPSITIAGIVKRAANSSGGSRRLAIRSLR